MQEKYNKIENLSVSENLAKFINKELLPGTKINKKKFWKGFDKYLHELTPINRELLQKRQRYLKRKKKFIITLLSKLLKSIIYL